MEEQGADIGRRVKDTQPEEPRGEDEVEETGEGFGRVGVEYPGNGVGFELLELRTRAGAVLRRTGGTGDDFLEELKDERQEGLVGSERTRVRNPEGILTVANVEGNCQGRGVIRRSECGPSFKFNIRLAGRRGRAKVWFRGSELEAEL